MTTFYNKSVNEVTGEISFKMPTVKVNKEQLTLITSILTTLVKEKGDMNKMVSVEDIESALIISGCTHYVPVTLALRALVDAKYIRYYKLESGKLMWGYTQTALNRMLNESMNGGEGHVG